MKNLIEVTSAYSGKKVLVNILEMGAVYEVEPKPDGSVSGGRKNANITGTLHNNGGLNVIETYDEIMEKIKAAQR